ncbi:MAG: DUF1801 domain-containing protein [Bauldia sp.]|nr:DUF1801 domain-containing protein [Bauldia sp.]
MAGKKTADNKTKPHEGSVELYLAAVEPEVRREDAVVVDALMRRLSGEEPKMWGPSIIGYGHTTLHYHSGRVVEAPKVAFAPRKPSLVFYLGNEAAEPGPLLRRLGKHKASKGCIYVNRLADIDLGALEALVQESLDRSSG